jgi:hypothetical protein
MPEANDRHLYKLRDRVVFARAVSFGAAHRESPLFAPTLRLTLAPLYAGAERVDSYMFIDV